jgi:molybdopterin biosynthesis enzyme
MTLDEAIAQALAHVEPITERERVPTLTASGRVLAEEILCPHDVPGFARAAMDGYAVRAADLAQASRDSPVTLRVIGAAAMGQDPRTLPTVGEGEALEISTGAPVPPGADAVVMVEQTARLSGLDGADLLSSGGGGSRAGGGLGLPARRACLSRGA